MATGTGTERIPTFTPPRVNLGDVLQRATSADQLLDPGKLNKELLRVFIDKSKIFPKQTYISSKPEAVVLLEGGKPMNENRPNVQVLRTDPNLAEQSFIVAALIVFSRAYEGIPFVLQYDTYRPWAGSYPHHL